jgi:hypothetical protein
MKNSELLCALRLAVWPSSQWTYKELSSSLGLAYARTHEAVAGAAACRLYDMKRKRVAYAGLMEFLEHGVKYAFPAYPGERVVGIRTAADAAPMRDLLSATDGPPCVWESEDGQTQGIAVAPLHRLVPAATRQDMDFYELMALIDVLRLNQSVRQVNLAKKLLSERLTK